MKPSKKNGGTKTGTKRIHTNSSVLKLRAKKAKKSDRADRNPSAHATNLLAKSNPGREGRKSVFVCKSDGCEKTFPKMRKSIFF